MRIRIAAIGLALLARTADSQTPEQVERLAVLGKAWGFLKYFHPGVAGGTVDWDSALVAVVPRAIAAKSNAELDATVQSLLDAAGSIKPCTCAPPGPDSMRANLDLRWLGDAKMFSTETIKRLEQARDNHHQGSGRYVAFNLTARFDQDTAFFRLAELSVAQRLDALFRFWNAVRYYYPYLNINGGDWNAVLTEFIPRMINARDQRDYGLAVTELATRVHDTHVSAANAPVNVFLGTHFPSFQARWIDGRIVVWRLSYDEPADLFGLHPGDVITSVNGQSVAERRAALARYVAAGNPATIERKLVDFVLRIPTDTATYVIDRNGETITLRVAMARPPASPTLPKYPVADLVKVLPNNVGYVDMGRLEPAQVDSAIAIIRNTSGIVMDVRNYPRGTYPQFAAFFNPSARPFVKFTAVDPNYPGQLTWMAPMTAGLQGGNVASYHGRVAILVDERTQSHAEFTVMALRTAPENKVIGSQTAGADGNVTFLSLPGGVRTLFTGLGVFYPDGRPTQRIGIVPDIEIRPTIKGFRAGRDEVLERAIEYLRTGR